MDKPFNMSELLQHLRYMVLNLVTGCFIDAAENFSDPKKKITSQNPFAEVCHDNSCSGLSLFWSKIKK